MQYAGVIKAKSLVSHTAAGSGHLQLIKSLLVKSNIKHGKIIFPVNKKIPSIKINYNQVIFWFTIPVLKFILEK